MSVILSKPVKRGDQEIITITITDTIKQAARCADCVWLMC
jgi:ABC-type phosphate transport system ATPase subunit